jgi:hypothetical protein
VTGICEECTWREERNKKRTGEAGGLCMNREISVEISSHLLSGCFGPKKRGKEQRPNCTGYLIHH